MPKTEQRTLTRRVAVVEYEDGRIEEYNLAKPIYGYQVEQLGLDAENSGDTGYFALWFAAGKPGANGEALTADTARPLMEAWLATIETLDMPDVDEAPPTKAPGTSRTSRA